MMPVLAARAPDRTLSDRAAALVAAGIGPAGAPYRTAFLIFGGLAVLQGSDGLSAAKGVYLLGVGAAFAGALLSLGRLEGTRAYRLLRPLVVLSLVFGMLVALSLAVSVAHGASATAWFRDAAPYLLLATVPVFALDLHASASRNTLVLMFVIAGALATVSYTVEWLDRRSLADLPVTRIAMPSSALRFALYVFALSGALLNNRKWPAWAALAAAVLSLAWITGNRADSVLLLLIAPVVGALAFIRNRDGARAALRLAAVLAMAAVFTLALTQLLAQTSGYDTGRAAGRFETINNFSTEDLSFQYRAAQTNLAWRTFVSNPIFGAGPGHLFEWTNVRGIERSSAHIDTALSFPAKFGAIGAAFFLLLVAALVQFLRNAGRQKQNTVAQTALAAFALLAIMAAGTSAPLEDKGLSFGLVFLLALVLLPERDHAEPARGRVAEEVLA